MEQFSRLQLNLLDHAGAPCGDQCSNDAPHNETFHDHWNRATENIAPLVALGCALTVVTAATIIGNLFVMLAIWNERDLKQPQYFLILSLAFTDLMVGIFVLPLATVNEITGGFWTLGVFACKLWISLDVLCCTASIWHLVAIAADRYRSIVSVSYSRQRRGRTIVFIACFIWFVALAVSVAPFLGWKDTEFEERLQQSVCVISQNVGYQTFSTLTAFYIPLVLIVGLYIKILRVAKKRIRMKSKMSMAVSDNGKRNLLVLADAGTGGSARTVTVGQSQNNLNETEPPLDLEISTAKSSNSNVRYSVDAGLNSRVPLVRHNRSMGDIRLNATRTTNGETSSEVPLLAAIRRQKRREVEARRQRKAETTLLVITGTFIICWLPFFILAVIRPAVCDPGTQLQCPWPMVLDSLVLWLGYVNSSLNPILYTIFAPDFRHAFSRLLRRICSCCANPVN